MFSGGFAGGASGWRDVRVLGAGGVSTLILGPGTGGGYCCLPHRGAPVRTQAVLHNAMWRVMPEEVTARVDMRIYYYLN